MQQVPEVSDWIVTMLSQLDVNAERIFVRVSAHNWDSAVAAAEEVNGIYDGIAAVRVEEGN